MRWKFKNLLFFFVVICCQNLSAIELTLTQKKNLNSKIQLIRKIAANHIIINEVLLRNQKPLSKYENMSEEEWFRLQYIDQKVRFFTTTNSARILREKKDNSMTEMFINNASGTKVGFLSKTSSWNHKNKMKHTEAMKNKIWIGEIEKDLSSGTQQIQVSVPVLNNLIPIGSLVVGLAVHKLN